MQITIKESRESFYKMLENFTNIKLKASTVVYLFLFKTTDRKKKLSQSFLFLLLLLTISNGFFHLNYK